MEENNPATPKPSLFERFKNRKRPRRGWIIVMASAVLAGCFVVVFAFYQMRASSGIPPEARTSAMRSDVRSTAGGDATEQYRERVRELSEREAEEASASGRSYISSVDGQASKQESFEKEPAEEDPEPQEPERQELSRRDNPGNRTELRAMERRLQEMQDTMGQMQYQQQQQQQSAAPRRNQPDRTVEDYARQYGQQLANIQTTLERERSEQQIMVFDQRDSGYQQAGGSPETDTPQQIEWGTDTATAAQGDGSDRDGLQIDPGDILYARNEVWLNSDAPGPAQATVLSGEYRGAKLMGGFEKVSDYLTVEFNRMVLPNGEQHIIKGVAIDPNISATAVRSKVDRHILSRWGGLMAASFLAGFGDASSAAGSEMVFSDGDTYRSYPELDTSRELWVAAGRVGEELSTVMRRNFDRPSTVTLDPGANIGVLVLSVEDM